MDVLCNTKVPFKLKENFYRTVVSLTILYGIKCLSYEEPTRYKISIVEMEMLNWMCRKTRHDMIENDNIIDMVWVKLITEKMMETSLMEF